MVARLFDTFRCWSALWLMALWYTFLASTAPPLSAAYCSRLLTPERTRPLLRWVNNTERRVLAYGERAAAAMSAGA